MNINPNGTTGLIIMAHGSPKSEDEFEDFLTSIRRGRRPEEDLIAEVKRRYKLIGGLSPLIANTQNFFKSLERSISEATDLNGSGNKVILKLGYKHVEPRISSAVKSLVDENVYRIFGLIASTYYSKVNIEDYNTSVLKALEEISRNDIVYKSLPALSSISALTELFSKRLRFALDKYPNAMVIFSAHSLPIVALGDDITYQNQHETLAKDIADKCGLTRYIVAYQSGTLGAGRWLGPDINEVITSGLIGDAKEIIAAPIGFVSEHAEILYDLDIELKATCDSHRIKYSRIEMPNDSQDFIDLISGSILQFINQNDN